eukprot:gene7005-22507_t
MVQGTVMKWKNRSKDAGIKHSYGFAVTPKGQTVFIPYKNITDGKGKRLQVGAKVHFEIEHVEGHDGRVLGKNVTGPGVVSWDEWKENDDGKAMALKAKEQWQAHKEKQTGWTKKERPAGGRGGRGGGDEKRGERACCDR